MNLTLKRVAVAVAACMAPAIASATNGYFSHGYGIKAKGMAGVGIALPQDAMAAATNPAGMAFVGNRVDLGVDWFQPKRGSEITGNGFGLNGSYDANDASNFFIPEFGYNRMINPNVSLGITVYGNGGMNTEYGTSPFAAFGGTSPAGVNLEQLFIAPTVAWKITPNNSIGLSLNLAYQRFEATGLQPFGMMSMDPSKVTNNGTDSSTGWGVRLGWLGKLSDSITLGATWQSKTKMSRFDKYAGLFADQGDFDIPMNYGLGIAWKATPELTIAADWQRIEYSGVNAVGNSIALLFQGLPLGASAGPGFGWQDMNIFKIGASWQMNPGLTLRAGYSHGGQPIPSNETFFNILAPGVIEDHLTLGATWTLQNGHEVTLAYMHGFSNTVYGSGSIPPAFGGGEANLKMHQNSLGIAYGWKF